MKIYADNTVWKICHRVSRGKGDRDYNRELNLLWPTWIFMHRKDLCFYKEWIVSLQGTHSYCSSGLVCILVLWNSHFTQEICGLIWGLWPPLTVTPSIAVLKKICFSESILFETWKEVTDRHRCFNWMGRK